jgi:putative addiction module killer protein
MVSKVLPLDVHDVREYLTGDGVSPFSKWRGMLDVQTRVRIDRVVERFVDGNLGDHKSVGAGVMETRINFGPGYRIYYGRDGDTILILLAGGSKRSQDKDIQNAKERWKDYKERKRKQR